ncbi:unknown similar to AMEV216 [Choristoneura rosaceana entomopoxvirus 'L']|uniref:Uncharacterized protein n=1 Tax=Choristoneura rosaceana entomopoxvirus 'L' TaxID=1293539 RepID=A0ABP1WL44_9POXV|nr:unknown similar to AMEV216 [Choristoneura rosaceana entomopoxvirus 'L']CCU56112.1 unknown similar to AMEV216 [Choristoneura rosaceana entomopoxvirus 'L']
MYDKIILIIFILLFSSIKSQYICSKDSPDIAFRMPDILDCTNINPIKAKILLRTLNEKSYKTEAILFTNMALTCITADFLNAMLGEQDIHIRTSDTVDYDEMLQTNNTNIYRNKTLVYDKDTNSYIFGNPIIECVTHAFYRNTFIKYYIKLVRGEVYYRKGKMLSNIANTDGCEYTSKYCQIGVFDTLVWTIDPKALGIYYNISKPIDVDIIENKNKLHILFNYLGNKIALVVDKLEYENNKTEFINTNDHEFTVKILQYNETKKVKRDINDYENRLQYNNDILALQKVRTDDICYELSLETLQIYSMCTTNPYSCVSTLLNKKNINVRVVGNIYLVKLCSNVTITEYKPAYDKINNICHELIPIIFDYHNKSGEGYYNIQTGEIFLNTRFIKTGSCDSNNRYIPCDYNNENICVYDNILGGIKQINITKYIITKNNNEIMSKLKNNNRVTPLSEYEPSITDMINRPISTNNIIDKKHIYNLKKENKEHTEIILIISLAIILLIIGIFTFFKLSRVCLKIIKKNISDRKINTEIVPMVSVKI